MTAQQLKNSILQMAVQGKLVPQDPSDEPASVLLERIRTEKEQLIKQKKIKREKNPSYIFRGADNTPYEKIGNNEPVSIADEVPFEIPDSWEWVRLGDIFWHNTGKALNSTNRNGTLLSYITTSNLYWSRFELDSLREMYFTDEEIEKCTATKGDLLVCEGGDIGRAAIWPFDYEIRIQNHIHRLRAYAPICTEYYYYLFYLYKHVGWIGGKGIGIQGLSSNALHDLLFPLPPLAEQERIVAKIKTIEPYTDRYAVAATNLDKLNNAFPDMLKKSILQMAVQGKLVPQNPDDEPASVLLERIRAEKQRLVKEGKIKKDKHESVIFRRDNSHYEKCGADEICIDDVIPFDIPESWIWVRLITLTEEKPANGYSPKGVGYATEVKNLTLTATTSGYFKSDAYKYVDVEIPSDSKYWLKHNDILIQRSNSRELVGTACVYTGEDNAFIYPDLMMRIRIMNGIDIRYIDYVLKSPFVRQYYTSSASGTSESMPKINQAIVSNTLIPLPPIVEQMRITKCIDKLLSRLTF